MKPAKTYPAPHLITFPQVGKPVEGYISIAEFEKTIPFEVKRVFWTYYTPESVVRGRHAHYETEQVLVAAAGKIIVSTESGTGESHVFVLEKPDTGVYIPPNVWHTMQYSHNAVQLIMASTAFKEEDYIRDFTVFQKTYHGP